MVEVLGLVEHVFAEHALVEPGRGNRRNVVEMPGANGLGELHGVARTVHVDGDLALGVGLQVVHRGQVVEVVDLPLERLHILSAHAQPPGGEVAEDGHDPRRPDAPVLAQRRHFGLALAANQEVHHGALALQQFPDEPLADEAGGTGDEVMHVLLLEMLCLQPDILAQPPQAGISR